jgi:hypothetical protein
MVNRLVTQQLAARRAAAVEQEQRQGTEQRLVDLIKGVPIPALLRDFETRTFSDAQRRNG